MNLVLIGYRGTGKTTVARHLAGKLAWDWVDADVEIELRAGKSIAAIFADHGERHFRDLESEILADFVGKPRTVLAAGGGAVLREDNRRQLRRCAHVVWLKASPAEIMQRVQADATTTARRPRLTTLGGEAEVIRLLTQREPWYRECATLEIDTERKSPSDIALDIIEQLNLSSSKDLA